VYVFGFLLFNLFIISLFIAYFSPSLVQAKRSPDLILISQRVIHIMDDTGLDAIDKIMGTAFF